jgi:hypothetical protein
VRKVAGNYCQQTTHHEDDHAKMQEQDGIGEVLVQALTC